MFRLLLVGILLVFLAPESRAQKWKRELLNYIDVKLSKSDGGYGWEDQYDSHLTPTYAVIGILYNIGALPADKAGLADVVRALHPQRRGYPDAGYKSNVGRGEAGPSGADMRNLVYEQIRSVLWLEGDASSFRKELKTWKSQAGILANYEINGFGGLFQETMIPVCHYLTGTEMDDADKFLNYLESCRRSNGSFNNAPATFGGDGNILNTWWALYALESLSGPSKLREETILWLNACQLENGGFSHQPDAKIGANDDVIYTWAAIKALKLLDSSPRNLKETVNYLVSLRNSDGGFGDRPGLHSTPMASFYAIDALKELGMLSALNKSKTRKPVEENIDFTGYKIYTVQFQAHGQGSPGEAIMLADSLNIDLWGVKYPVDGWIKEVQRMADERKAKVTFFMSNEPHDNLVTVPGMGSFNHVLDYISPGPAEIPFANDATWEELKNTTLKELKEVNGGLMLQVSNNEPLARMLIDESLNSGYGYLALSTIHFGQNFMFWLPYLAEYRYRLPLVTLQDAHGTEPWVWTDELVNHRNLFIAKEPTYNEMINALRNNWIVGVRHDSVSGFRTRMLGGTDATRKFISERENEWKWWTDDNRLKRPIAAITVIGKDDLFEQGKPDEGLNIRIRCRWNGVRQTLRSPSAILLELTVDGETVYAEEFVRRSRNIVSDAYYLYEWKNPEKGDHLIKAVIKDLQSGKTYSYKTVYSVF